MNKQHSNIAEIVSSSTQVPERRSLADEAADRLRELILLEKLAPGTPIPERDLAEGLGISRTPLKEALRLLEIEGLVEYSPTRRPKVANPSLEEIAQNIAVLSALEALAGEMVCRIAPDEELAAIRGLVDQMRALASNSEPLEFFHLDMAFHARVIEAARNEPLRKTHKQYNARLWRARFLSSRQLDRRENTLSEHDAILAAILRRDPSEAAHQIRNHLESTVKNLHRHLSKRSENGS